MNLSKQKQYGKMTILGGQAISGVIKGGGVLCMPDIGFIVVQMKGVFFVFLR